MQATLSRTTFLIGTLGFAVLLSAPRSYSQTPAGLNVQMYAGLSITGSVGRVYTIQYSTNLSETNNWVSLTNLILPSSPFLFVDTTTPATAQRFYQAITSTNPLGFIWIPPGTFTMGTPTGEGPAKESPETSVTLTKGFFMGKYEVTQGEYLSVVSNNPSAFSLTNGHADYLSRPVETVSWFEATNYCAALTQREHIAGRLQTNWVYRLPTEAEWEYACRAGTTNMFSYGDDPDYTNLTYYAWYNANSASQTHPVGQKLPNPWGLYDMHGNVAEMCQDWFGLYPGGSVIDP